MQFYNTLTKSKEEFTPIEPGAVRMYTCGPTVYNYAHIGNYRSYIFADVLKRALIYQGFKTKHIMNLTDVDDKTIRDSQKENKTLKEFTEFYTEKFYEDIKSLNILPPEKFTKATDNIPEMVEITKKLLDKGLAYKSEDGSVYFSIKKFKEYGRLSDISPENQKENAAGRIKKDEYDKENVQDFALWKAWDASDGDVFWETELGKGRPGWHIECSAMSMKYLGEQLDIHTGGVDLIFPHHENEIAQSEGATGKQFVKYWLHNEWVLVDGIKMAKSSGNFYTLHDIKMKVHPLAFRLWTLMAHYQTRINFTWEAILAAETTLKQLYKSYLTLTPFSVKALAGKAEVVEVKAGKISEKYQKQFKKFIEDNLNTPQALTVLWDLLEDKNISYADKKETLNDFDKVLGLGLVELKEEIPEEIKEIVQTREIARENKDWRESDRLRQLSAEKGYGIDDTSSGPNVWKMYD